MTVGPVLVCPSELTFTVGGRGPEVGPGQRCGLPKEIDVSSEDGGRWSLVFTTEVERVRGHNTLDSKECSFRFQFLRTAVVPTPIGTGLPVT